jgi:hypothetical protein
MTGMLEAVGAQVRNPSRGKPIHIARMETGLFTNRSPLHDPASWYISKYGGYPDALIDGSNMEISNALTLIRRPGLSEWSSVTVPDQINWFYDWRTLSCGPKVVVDTTTSTYIQSATTQNLIFTKSAGAHQGQYQGVADTLYYGDGVDLQKFILGADCNPANGKVSNWGIVAGPTAPVVTITPSASATVQWQQDTVFSTMGLILDSNGNIEQLISVNAQPATNPNSTRFGLGGNGEPNWNQTPGGFTLDNGWDWTNFGPITFWQPGHSYNNSATGGTLLSPCIIFDPITNCCQVQANPAGTSGTTRPNFSAAVGGSVPDNNLIWFNFGVQKTPQPWKPGMVVPTLDGSRTNTVVEPVGLAGGLPSNQTVFYQVNFTGSTQTTGAGGTSPPWSITTGTVTGDNQLAWLNLGSSTRLTNTAYVAFTAQGTVFSVIIDANANFQVCTTSGVSSATATSSISWAEGYGQTTVDGTVVWTCVGQVLTWAANQTWYLPTTGWFPPSGAVPYGGALIIDSNNNIEAAVRSGQSKTGAHPTWAASGNLTADSDSIFALTQVTVAGPSTTYTGTITGGAGNAYAGSSFLFSGFTNFGNNVIAKVTASTATTLVVTTTTQVNETHSGIATHGLVWFNLGVAQTQGFSITKSVSYAYSYKSRTANDIYNTTAPPDWPSALGPPTGSGTGHVSTASPLFTFSSAFPTSVVTLTIPGSPDPQVDTIVIWRTLDGGSTLFFLTEVPNTPPIGGIQQFQTVKDVQPDSVINQFIEAPINNQNNPPPAGFLPMAYHFERIWGAVGNFVFASGGPDVLTGNPNEAFDPLDFFEFPSPVTRIVPTATGILVFLTSDVYAILGGPVFTTFFPTPMIPGVGLLHYNALDIHGGVIYMYTSDNQFISLDPSGGAQRMGGPIQDKLALFDSTKVFVTVHESGNDNAVYISDGVTGWYRLNPSQFPNNLAVWSPFATITGGAGAVLSIEVSNGVHRLLVGGIGSNKHILQRDFSTYEDDGTPYTCSFTMGNINLVNPGQIAGLTFVNLRATRVGTTPTVGFLLNEISGTFTTFPQSQAYPWQIYGATKQPTSLYSNAYYFRAAGVPALAEHMQVKVSFPAENFANEVLSLTVFGTVEQPPEE